MMKNKSVIVLFLILVLISLPTAAQESKLIEATEALEADISVNETFTGNITPVKNINIPAQIGSLTEKVNVEIGDQIEAGTKLVIIDDQELLIQKRQAEASLESARANYQQLKNGATEEEISKVKASYENAKNGLESAKTNLKLMEEIYNNRRSLEQQLVSAEQQLNNTEQQLESSKQNLKQAENNFEQAKKDYQRSQNLYEDNVISEKEYENAKSGYENAETNYNSAQIAVEQAKTSLAAAEKNYRLTKENYDNPTQLQQQLESARSQLNSARTNLRVAEANLNEVKKGARQEQLTAAFASVKQAEANFDQIKDQLDKTTINAPFSGFVNQVTVEEGEMIGAGQAVVNLMNLEELYVEIDVNSQIVSAINKGEQVEVKPENMQHFMEGVISNIAPAADPASRSFLVKVKIPNLDHKLRAGMFADVKIVKGKSGSTVVVPIESIVDLNSDSPYLFVVESGKAVRKEIKLGISTDSQVEIREGLKAGEKIVVRGQNNLKEGQPVEVRNR